MNMKKTIHKAAMALSALLCFATTGAFADGVNIKFEANGNSTIIENVELPHTFVCDYNSADGDFDRILKELYGWPDHNYTVCYPDAPSSSDPSKVSATLDGFDHTFTICSAFEGAVTVTGSYLINEAPTSYSVAISIVASQSGPELTPTANENEWTFTLPAYDVALNVVYYTDDEVAAMAVDALIADIGEVAYSEESKGKLDAARAAYGALTAGQKALVAKYATLTADETTYLELELYAAGFVFNDGVLSGVLSAYIGEGGDVVIPDVVTMIGEGAFAECTNLTSVTIPGSVTNIGDSAFADCVSLANVTFNGDAPADVGEGAFENVPETCAVFVQPGSEGWDVVPGTWQGLPTWYEGSVFRFYSKNYKGHFFTIDEAEAESVKANPNWKYEGVAYYVYPSEIEGAVPVFRFWSKRYRHHFYTIDEAEKDDLIAHNPNWAYEGIAFYALPAEAVQRRALARKSAAKGRAAATATAAVAAGPEYG